MKNKVYYEKKLAEGLYAIAEKHLPDSHQTVMMYLVIGEDKAALIDSGFGVTNTLRGFVETLTDKPIVCLVAHGHPDHAGAAALFDEIHMNPEDDFLLPVSLSYERRMDDVFGHGEYDGELKAYCEEHIVMCEKLPYKPLQDGDVFDLGGRKLETVFIPGHTRGSAAFVDRENNVALVSDCFSRRTAMVKMPTEKRAALNGYKNGLQRFLDMISDDTLIYWGHGEEPVDHSVPRDMLCAVQEVLDGKTENDRPSVNKFTMRPGMGNAKMTEHVCGGVMLVYDANTL